jgi:hypothetical protein
MLDLQATELPMLQSRVAVLFQMASQPPTACCFAVHARMMTSLVLVLSQEAASKIDAG